MEIESSSKIYNLLNNHKGIYLLIGFILFLGGVCLDIFWPDQLISIAASHFMLILGEALIVFFLINVVLEKETRNTFLLETTKLIKQQEQIIIDSFDVTSDSLLKKTESLFSNISHELFKVVLTERTSPEIAMQMNKSDYFQLGFLYYDYSMKYDFSLNGQSEIILIQEDDFCIKNFSKNSLQYLMPFSMTETSSKKYEFVAAGYSENITNPEYIELTKIDFNIHPLQYVKSGLSYELNEKKRKKVDPNKSLHVFTSIKTTFKLNPDGIDDFTFSNHYMMPYKLEVNVPDGFEFFLYPTFPAQKLNPARRVKKGKYIYEIPFLTPGQGYNFSLVKH